MKMKIETKVQFEMVQMGIYLQSVVQQLQMLLEGSFQFLHLKNQSLD